MTIDPSLLNASSTVSTNTTYDRSYGGAFENPFSGVPAMVFFRHTVVVDSNNNLLKESALPNAREVYVPGKVYPLIDPTTNLPIPGQTFTSDQFFDMVYSVMMQNLLDQEIALTGSPSPSES